MVNIITSFYFCLLPNKVSALSWGSSQFYWTLSCLNIYSIEEFSVLWIYLTFWSLSLYTTGFHPKCCFFIEDDIINSVILYSLISLLNFWNIFSWNFSSSAFLRFCYCSRDLSHVQAPVKHPVLSPALLPTRQVLRDEERQRQSVMTSPASRPLSFISIFTPTWCSVQSNIPQGFSLSGTNFHSVSLV